MPEAPAPGDVLAGKFRVERVLGQGGMGVVVAAHHLQLDERVALKFLLASHARNAEVVARFGREARAAAKIRSEHVARVTDVGVLEDGSPYMVMEYLEGEDLAQLLARQGARPLTEAVDYVLQALEALAEAHRLGIVHRDLKPANLFRVRRVDGTPCVKVLDFGISKLASADQAHQLTHTAGLMGSPLYMSPEQLRSARDVDARADVWALGVILFELLTAQHPFRAEDLPRLTLAIVMEPPASLRALRPELPAEIEAIVARCLAKERDARFSDVAALAAALAPYASAVGQAGLGRIRASINGMAAASSVDPEAPSAASGADAGLGESKGGAGRDGSDGALGVGLATTSRANLAISAVDSEPARPKRSAGLLLLLPLVAAVGVVALWGVRRAHEDGARPAVAASAPSEREERAVSSPAKGDGAVSPVAPPPTSPSKAAPASAAIPAARPSSRPAASVAASAPGSSSATRPLATTSVAASSRDPRVAAQPTGAAPAAPPPATDIY